ncbi:flagellar protein FlgN [Breoghania sp.]|uniref:flagellar protein FlgN n=1 Tax=Breoghania sp. TaxID=2065378 RepID=UPI0026074DC2|nr:flagellar protein FlgN [Breoghania sp.]MDJ0929496.1 flagellar protein FlgN [Breoghania sp.]
MESSPCQPSSVADVSASGRQALIVAIERANAAVVAETTALRKRAGVDLRDFERRKSQALLDLTRAGRNLSEGSGDAVLAAQLGVLRSSLHDNMQLLSTHLRAVQEISELISRSLIEAESDGTYLRQVGGERI